MELNKQNTKKILLIVLIAIATYTMLQNFDRTSEWISWFIGLFRPILIGLLIAFILNVPMVFFERKVFIKIRKDSIRRMISIFVTVIVALGVVFLVIFMIVPEIGNTIDLIIQNVPGFINKLQTWITELAKDNPDIMEYLNELDFNWETFGQNILTWIQNIGTTLFSSTMNVLSGVIGGLFSFFIGLIFAFYVMMQKETLSVQFKAMFYAYLPQRVADRILFILRLSNKTFKNFVRGQGLESVILGFMVFLTMVIAGYPYALTIGVLTTVMSFIPIFGSFVGCFVGAFLLLLVDPIKALIFIILFIAIQQIEGNLIYPHVVGNKIGLPPIWVLFAVTLGGNAMGVLGMILFIPLASIIYTLLKSKVLFRLKNRRVDLRKIQDIPPDEAEDKRIQTSVVKEYFDKLFSSRQNAGPFAEDGAGSEQPPDADSEQ